MLYAEFEDTSADKTIREVVGHDGLPDFLVPNWLARMDQEREIELKLILGSNVHGWNISENFIAEKNFAGDPWEFGYAFGSQPSLCNLPPARTNAPFARRNFRRASKCTAAWATPMASGCT